MLKYLIGLSKAVVSSFLLLMPLFVIGQSYPKTIKLDIDDGLIQNTVWAIEEDLAHRIWIGTPGGLQVYDGFELVTLPEVEGTILRLQMHNSFIYCVTISNLYKFNPLDFSFSQTTFSKSYFYLTSFSDEGIALSGSNDSLVMFYNYDLQRISNYSGKENEINEFFDFSLSGYNFYGGINGLFSGDSIPISDSYCKQFVKYNSYRAFVASHKGLIEISTAKNQLQVKHHFKDLRITHLLVDINKNLWVATADNGIFMIHRNSLHTNYFSKTKSNGEPMSCWRFSEIGDQLFVSTAYGLIPVEQSDWQNNKVYQNTKNLACNTAVEGDGFLIIGTRSDGIYRLKNDQLEQVFINPAYQVDNIIVQVERNSSGFLASSKYSFIQLDSEGNYVSQTKTDFSDVFGYTMEFFTSDTGIMNSRTTGLVELDLDLNPIAEYTGDSLQVVSMMRPFQNEWWGVSMDAGLIKLENEKLIKKPFPDKHLFTLKNWNDSILWISGIHGIYKYSEALVRPFKQQNGFPILEYNQNAVYRDSLGFLYYAGVGGIHMFHPDSLADFPNFPTVLIERNGIQLDPSALTKLEFDQSEIMIDVHPVSITDQNYFRIEVGTGMQWVKVEHPKQLNFSLPYGKFEMNVRVTDLVNGKNEITCYTFHRAFPFWQKPWFIILVILLVIFLIIGLVSFIGFIKTRKQHKLDQIRIEEQQKGLSAVIQAQEDERKRIAKDLHDGIVQQLGGLNLGLQKVFEDKETTETKKLLSILDESTKELRELSHKMMPRALVGLGLIPALKDMLENSLGNTSIKYQFEHFGITTRFNENIEISIYRIAQELVNNVIKHSNATKVNVQLFKVDNELIFIIEDNGSGMDISQRKDGIGLMNISSRLETLNGNVNFKPSPENGTLATIKIPVL